MKTQKFGVEIELTGLTRSTAGDVLAEFFCSEKEHICGSYDTYQTKDEQGRDWKVTRDASIHCQRKKNGKLENTDSTYSVELVTPILTYEDIPTLQEIVRRLRQKGAIANSSTGLHIHIGAEKHTPQSLRNIINLMASKEDLIYKSLQVDTARLRYCKKVNEQLLQTINKKKPKTIAELSDIWYKEHHAEYGRNAHYNDSRYHGLNLHSTFTKGTIEFRLFNSTTHAGVIRSYIVFCLAISHQALTQKSASAKRTYTDNEKYTFRCWLLRLGLIGDEFKNCREHLMKSLSGNSAWRTVA